MAASNSTELEKLWKLTCPQLREVLKRNNKPTSGTKSVLVAKCFALKSRTDSDPCSSVPVPESTDVQCDPLAGLNSKENVTYNELLKTASGRQWSNDLRSFPILNFHQLFEYLVEKTQKYGNEEMKGMTYKKMKAYQFFKEGHISKYNIAKAHGITWVKAEVIASMKHERYRVLTVFAADGDIKLAACDCPAG